MIRVVELTSGQLAAGGVPSDLAERVSDNPMAFVLGAVALGLFGGALIWRGVSAWLDRRETVPGIHPGERLRAPRRAR